MADEWKILRDRGRCEEAGCPLATADEVFAVLELPECRRHELCATCFHRHVAAAPAEPIFWKVLRRDGPKRGPTIDLASLRVLFERLDEVEGDEARGLRYFVALLLLRKRVLKMVQPATTAEESADLVVIDPRLPGAQRVVLFAPELEGDRMSRLKDELLAALSEQEAAGSDAD